MFLEFALTVPSFTYQSVCVLGGRFVFSHERRFVAPCHSRGVFSVDIMTQLFAHSMMSPRARPLFTLSYS